MKFVFDRYSMYLGFLGLFLVGCTIAHETPEKQMVETVQPSILSITNTLVPIEPPTATVTEAKTQQPTQISTPSPPVIVLPSVTMSPQQAKDALSELLRSNGNCTGKCIAGIRPDEMTVQEAVDKLAEWGMVSVYENPDNGETYFRHETIPFDDRIRFRLSVGTLTKKMEKIENVSIRFDDGYSYLAEEIWLENRDAWRGFQIDGLLNTYGIPSYVGSFYATNVEVGSSLEGRTIDYAMVIDYEQIDLVVTVRALAYYDGENLFICPSKDPRMLLIEINSEETQEHLKQLFEVTWEELSGKDLNAFYELYTEPTNPDACITTTLHKIEELQPWFR